MLAHRLTEDPTISVCVIKAGDDLSLFSEWIWPSEDQFKTDGQFDRSKFIAFIKKYAWGHHASGTCKMGPKTDDLAVVDQRCRIHGIKGLRVVDSSISPVIPTAIIHRRMPLW